MGTEIENEIWKSIINYEGLYEISNYGRVKRFNKTKQSKPFKILKLVKNSHGYLFVRLCINGRAKNCLIHMLVAEAFIGPRPEKMQICHNNGNKENNFIANLRYDTPKNNTNDKIKHGTIPRGSKHANSKLINDNILKIRKLSEKGELSQKAIGKLFGVSQYIIWAIVNHKLWKHVN